MMDSVCRDIDRITHALNRRSGVPSSRAIEALESFNEELAALVKELRTMGREPEGTLH
jgi:hypothetical protein